MGWQIRAFNRELSITFLFFVGFLFNFRTCLTTSFSTSRAKTRLPRIEFTGWSYACAVETHSNSQLSKTIFVFEWLLTCHSNHTVNAPYWIGFLWLIMPKFEMTTCSYSTGKGRDCFWKRFFFFLAKKNKPRQQWKIKIKRTSACMVSGKHRIIACSWCGPMVTVYETWFLLVVL